MGVPFFPINPEDLPEELRAMISERLNEEENAVARGEDRMNRFFNFMRDLDAEQLGTLKSLLATILRTDKPVEFVNMLYGQADAVMRISFPELCRDCGNQDCVGTSPHAAQGLLPQQRPWQMDPEATRDVNAALEQAARMASMKEYGLVPNPTGNTDFKCSNCGIEVISLEDRMLRQPGPAGCSGCIQQTKHG